MEKAKILIVEDELFSAEYLKSLLSKNGYEVVDIITKGALAITKAKELQPDLILMDIMLKDRISGSEAALSIKQHSPHIGVIFLTAYADDEMVNYATQSNTYGYLIKPYKELEILATIKIALSKMRQSSGLKETVTQIVFSDSLSYDLKSRKLFKNTQEVLLGVQAQGIVDLLVKHLNSSVSSEQIALEVWGEEVNSVTLRTTINRIRSLVDKAFISSIRGYGYMIKSRVE